MSSKSFRIIFNVLLSACIFFLSGNRDALAQTSFQMVHFPVQTGVEGRSITIEVKIEGSTSQVNYLRIYYRTKGEEGFKYVEMDEDIDGFIGRIPANDVVMPAIEYFLMAVLNDNSIVSYPESNPYYAPLEVTLSPRIESKSEKELAEPYEPSEVSVALEEESPIQVLILCPEPGERVAPQEVVIAVSFLSETSRVDVKAIRITLDGKDVTRDAEITPNMLSLAPVGLKEGRHRIKVEIKDVEGNVIPPVAWKFVVSRGAAKFTRERESLSLIPLNGRVFAETKSENISGGHLSTNNLGTKFSGKFGALRYRGNLFITSREKADQQPRNRYSLTVGTSWIGVTFGDANPYFNDLILWGKRVRGIEGYLKLGFFNLEFVHGETKRAVEGISTLAPDSTLTVTRPGTYSQTLMGVRPSFGSGKHFQLGFNLLKVKDDINSIDFGVNPKDNVVLGTDILFAFDNHRIELKAGVAFSLLANDISDSVVSKAQIDSAFGIELPFDPREFERYFHINTSLTPLDPTKLSSLAYNASFKFNYFNNLLQIQYKSIGPEFHSLGNTFLRKDIQGFSISDRIRLLKNQVYLTVGYEDYMDNFSRDDNNPTTSLKTVNFGISYFPHSSLPRVNLNYRNHNRNNSVDTTGVVDLRINNDTRDLSLNLGYDVNFLNLDHSFNIGVISSDRLDGFSRNHFNLASDIKTFSLKTRYKFPLTTTVSYATSENMAVGGQSTFKYNSWDLRGEYLFLNGNLRVMAGLKTVSASGFNMSVVDTTYTDYNKTSFNLRANYRLGRFHFFLLDANLIKFKNKGVSQGIQLPSYNDSIIRLRYEMKF